MPRTPARSRKSARGATSRRRSEPTSAAGSKVDVFAHAAAWQAGRLDEVDTLAADGVTCTVCHQIDRERLGTPESYNGNFVLAPPLPSGNRRANGPHPPDAGRLRIMHSVTGVEQAEAPHIRQSELCASCHTLITNALGPKGEVIGSLPEQMTYPEWRHSAQQQSCQACHMPPVRGPIRISSVLGQDRDTLARHTFLGGNAFMLRLLNRFRVQLGVQATPTELEANARATTRLLETETATRGHRPRRADRRHARGRCRDHQPDRPQVPHRLSLQASLAARDGARRRRHDGLRVGPRLGDRTRRGQRQRCERGRVRTALRRDHQPRPGPGVRVGDGQSWRYCRRRDCWTRRNT